MPQQQPYHDQGMYHSNSHGGPAPLIPPYPGPAHGFGNEANFSGQYGPSGGSMYDHGPSGNFRQNMNSSSPSFHDPR